MRIDSIQIHNFRGIENLALDFDPHFNLLVGDNGSGKTSILSAVSVALGIWHLSEVIGNQPWRDIEDHEVRETRGLEEGGETQFSTAKMVQIRASGHIGKSQQIEWRRGRFGKPGSATVDQDMVQAERAIDVLQVARELGEMPLPLLAYYGAGRAWRPSNKREKPELDRDFKSRQADGYRYCLDELIRVEDLMNWFLLQAARRDDSGRFKPAYQAVRLALKRGIPGVEEIEWDPDKAQIVVQIDGVAQPFTNLSDGQRTMASTIADMAIRAVTLNPHLLGDNGSMNPEKVLDHTPGVVLIDELDVHLHPEWQRSVVQDLLRTFPKVQFICTSHSPQVIGETQPGSLKIYQPRTGTWETPKQSFGMDSNWILKVHMGGKHMDPQVKEDVIAAEKHAVRGEFAEAEALITSLRQRVGNSEEVQFAASTLERLQLTRK